MITARVLSLTTIILTLTCPIQAMQQEPAARAAMFRFTLMSAEEYIPAMFRIRSRGK